MSPAPTVSTTSTSLPGTSTLPAGVYAEAPSAPRVITTQRAPSLCFNYRSEENAVWDDRALQREHGYEARYPEEGTVGFRLIL